MKGLDSIIRLQEWKLDEKRRKVADLERFAQRLHDQIADLEQELRAEQKVAFDDPRLAHTYGGYAAGVVQRREKLRKSLAEVEQEMALALEEVAAAFREFKKFDLIRERHRERDAIKEKARHQSELDEAGLGVFRRRKSS